MKGSEAVRGTLMSENEKELENRRSILKLYEPALNFLALRTNVSATYDKRK